MSAMDAALLLSSIAAASRAAVPNAVVAPIFVALATENVNVFVVVEVISQKP